MNPVRALLMKHHSRNIPICGYFGLSSIRSRCILEGMRQETTVEGIRSFMRELGLRIRKPVKVYLTGGATCVMHGWRESTVDIDLKPVPDLGEVYTAIAQLKEELSLNIEMAAPDHFMPALPGWEERSEPIDTIGQVRFYHYDAYAQVLSKVARGFEQDLVDARKMMEEKDPARLLELFAAIRPDLVRYPAIDEKALTEKVARFLESLPERQA